MPVRRSFALVLLTTAVLMAAASPLVALDEGCPEGTRLWVFHNGLTPFTSWGSGSSALGALAQDWAEDQCAEAWALADPYVSQVNSYWTTTRFYSTGGPDPCDPIYRWSFSCKVCIEGYPPAWAQEVSFAAPIGLGEAGDSATGLVPGRLISGELRLGGDPGGDGATATGTPTYTFRILTDGGLVDVEVDAVTGRATRGTHGGVCQNR